jgi:hypothetical protein
MQHVWLLHHVHEFSDGHEDAKLIGAFATKRQANEARAQVANQPGFREHPKGFVLSKCSVGSVGWAEGFATVNEP